MCFEVMWNTAGTLSNLQEGYRDTTRKWLGHESGPKGWSLLTAASPIYTQLSLLNVLGTGCSLLKNLRPHRKRETLLTWLTRSTESHCWQREVCAERKTSPRKCCSRQIQTTSWSMSLVKNPAAVFNFKTPDRQKCPRWFSPQQPQIDDLGSQRRLRRGEAQPLGRVYESQSSSGMLNKHRGFLNGCSLMFAQVN